MEILALIPARGGSKSIPRKNLLKVGGKPLVAHSIQVALESKRITRTVVSTDDPEIGDVAESFGAEVPFQRPADISGDHATDLDVFRHALQWLDENEGYRPELIVQLRPTQPVRRASVVDQAIDLMLAHPEADSLRSVELTDQIPYKMWRIQAGKMVPVVELPGVFEAHSAPRQILPNVYQHNGYVDVIRRRTILEMGSICGLHVIPFMMDEHVVDLDYQEQIAELEAAFEKCNRKMTRLEVLALDVDGVLTDGRVALTPNGEETKAIAFRDLDALTLARSLGLRIALITGEDGPLVDIIAKKTGAEHVLRGAKDKLAAIGVLAAHMNVSPKSICFVGDADRDAKAFASVGLALAPADASSRARHEAHHVLKSRGGSGAVAEAVELVVSMSRASHALPAPTQVFAGIIAESIDAHRAMLAESISALSKISEVFITCIAGGNKILFCGNGGSAADSQHVAAELVGRFARERDPWPAISLTCDTSILTAVGNDWDFEQVFSRQVRALARPGDVVVGISTSGKSPNVVRALEAARAKGAITIGFTGSAGGPIADAADHVFRAPTSATPRVQELHILAWHSICEVVEARLAPDSRLV